MKILWWLVLVVLLLNENATLIEMNVPSWQHIARLFNTVLFNPDYVWTFWSEYIEFCNYRL